MSASGNVDLGEFNVGNTDRLRFTITKDGAVWNLSNAVVTVTFRKPDRRTLVGPYTMTAENAALGVFHYDTLVTDLDTAGPWNASVKVVDHGTTPDTVKRYPFDIGFVVKDEPY